MPHTNFNTLGQNERHHPFGTPIPHIDVTNSIVNPPNRWNALNGEGGLEVGYFFGIIVFASIVLFLMRLFKRFKESGVSVKSERDEFTKLI